MRAKFVKLLAVERKGRVELFDANGVCISCLDYLHAYTPSDSHLAKYKAREIRSREQWLHWQRRERTRLAGSSWLAERVENQDTLESKCIAIAASLRTRGRAIINTIARGEMGCCRELYAGPKRKHMGEWVRACKTIATKIGEESRNSDPWKQWSINRAANIRKRHTRKIQDRSEKKAQRQRNSRTSTEDVCW